MSDPFVAEIRMFAGNFAPNGWALCNGQLLPISQNTALFSLLGTMYGGDGKTTFALPNLQTAAPVHAFNLNQGAAGGTQTVTLLESEIPNHSHGVNVNDEDPANLTQPAANRILARSGGGNAYQTNTSANLQPMNPAAIAPAGASLPHNNMQPYLAVTFIIALQGIFPPRG